MGRNRGALSILAPLLLGSAFISGCGSSSSSGLMDEIHTCLQLNGLPSFQSEPAEIRLRFSDGSGTELKLWDIPQALKPRAGLLFVSGMPGGFTEPVDGIYDRLARRFAREGFVSTFVEYREPGDLELSVQDALAAAEQLRNRGVDRIALVGWSFGGAVITHSAPRIPEVRTVVGISAQSRDTEAVSQFRSQSLLLLHSYDDDNVPYEAASQILAEAPPGLKTELHSLSGYDHYLSGASAEVDPIITQWLFGELHEAPCAEAARIMQRGIGAAAR